MGAREEKEKKRFVIREGRIKQDGGHRTPMKPEVSHISKTAGFSPIEDSGVNDIFSLV